MSAQIRTPANPNAPWLPDYNRNVERAIDTEINGISTTVTLTGDVTGTGAGSLVTTIAAEAVTLAKMADMATTSLLGRSTAGTGSPEVLSASTARTLLNVADGATANAGTVTSVGGTGTVSGITLTGTVTAAGNLTLGGTLSLVSPPAIGSTTENTGKFSTLTATGAVTLSPASANVVLSPTGTGVVTINPATAGTINRCSIGATTTASGAFTTLAASSTVSGTGFSIYLASPPAIGGTSANTGKFSTLTATGAVTLSPANLFVAISPTGTGTVTINPAGIGTMDNVAVGATTTSTGAFTTLAASTSILSSGAAAGIGYKAGAGGAVTQATSRTTGVTLSKPTGAITLVSAAGTATWQSFTVTNTLVAATDTVIVSQKSGTDLYMIFVTAVGSGSFRISFATTGGTTTEQPVFNFALIKAVAA